MAATCGLSEDRQLKVLRQLAGQFRDAAPAFPAAGRRSLLAVVAGAPGFLLEWTVSGEVYLTGPPALHASPWRSLEAWGESIRHLFSDEGLSVIRIPLPVSRTAEIRALRRLGCRLRRRDEDCYGVIGVWECGR